MHLDECFQLAFSHSAAAAYASDYLANDHPYLFADHLPYQSNPQPPTQSVEGSVLSALRCIASEWATKSRTNFYIPPEHLVGYSYLFEDGEQQWHFLDEKARRPAFVHAVELSSLHSHHYEVYTHGSANSTDVSQTALVSMHSAKKFTSRRVNLALGAFTHGSPILTYLGASHTAMTVPYMHPHLGLPVPPLQLPWHFGVLCFSYAWAGVVMLRFPAKWALRSDERAPGDGKGWTRHWFPYRMFAWALVLFQSPCSFLADYVHMADASPWHTIDRFLACFMMVLELVKNVAIRPYTRPYIYLVYLMCCAGAVFCFLKSQGAQKVLDADGFVFWHNGWHCYPIVASVVYLAEIFLDRRWGEYCSFERQAQGGVEGREGERGVVPSRGKWHDS